MGRIEGGYRGPDIVSNGLVLYLDAGSPNSYRLDYGNTWMDMSGWGNNGTLTNGPTYTTANGGGIIYDATNDRTAINITFDATGFTFLFVMNYNSTQTAGYPRILSTNAGSDHEMMGPAMSADQRLRYKFRWASGNSANVDSGANFISTDTITFYGVTYASPNIIFYKNGAQHSTGSLTSSQTINWTSLVNTPDGGVPLACTLYIVQMYNRILSASEVLQNYNAQKSRFGL